MPSFAGKEPHPIVPCPSYGEVSRGLVTRGTRPTWSRVFFWVSLTTLAPCAWHLGVMVSVVWSFFKRSGFSWGSAMCIEGQFVQKIEVSLRVLCTVVLIWVVVVCLAYGGSLVLCWYGDKNATELEAWDPVPDADKGSGDHDLNGERSQHSRVVPAVTRQSNPDAVVRWIRRICGTSAEWEETYVPLIMSQSIDGATILSLSTERLIQLGFRESHAFLVFDKLHPQDNLEMQTPDFG